MYKKEMIKIFEKLGAKYDLWKVFSDFLELSAIAISNSCDLSEKSHAREQKYLDLINTYDEESRHEFPELFALLDLSLEDKVTDVLGELFMSLKLGDKWKGQCFTPYHISLASAKMIMTDAKKIVEEKGFMTVSDPCCGGGSLVIAAAQALKGEGINPQQEAMFICQDLDIRCVYMTYIQLSLLGVPAVVCHGNTITMEHYDAFYTPAWIIFGWDYKKQNEPKHRAVYDIKLASKENGQLEFCV